MMRDLQLARRGRVSPLQHQAQLEAIAALTAAERARAERAEHHHVPDYGDPVPVRPHVFAGGRPGVGLSALCRRRRPRWEGTLTRTVPGMPSAVPGRTVMACSASRLTSACSSGACTGMKLACEG
jgi:hypothetical protein